MLRTDLIRPVWELLAKNAAERGDRLAFRDDRVARNWAEMDQRTGNLAGHLAEAGTGGGGAVCVVMGNRVEGVESYLAAVRAGAVAVYLNPQAGNDELGYMLDDCGANLIITDADGVDRIHKLIREIDRDIRIVLVDDPSGTSGTLPYERLASTRPDRPPQDNLAMDAPAFMLYTSGTTGRPKGVLLSQHSCLWVVAAAWAPVLEMRPEDYFLSPLPLFHSYALDLPVLGILAVGCSERLLERFSPGQVIKLLREEVITVLPGVPTMFDYLLRRLGDDPLNARALRLCMSAGAIMPASLNERFERATGAMLLDGYGITEVSTMVTMNWPRGGRTMGSCGIPLPGSAVRLVDPATGRDVPVGDEGEVLVRGPHVMLGYHRNPQATAEVLRDGWYHTGDLARSDNCGYLTITGRIKELIIRGGENIYPAEVEEVLAKHPTIVDVAVAGEPHATLGETAVAFVVVEDHDAFDESSVRAFVAEHLAEWKVPERFAFIDAIPRTGSGKIQRRRLFEQTSIPSSA